MSAANQLTLLGNVGGANTIRTHQNNDGEVDVISFSLAVTEFRYNRDTKQNEKMTDWHTAKALGFNAKRIARFVEQGQKLLLKGRLYKETYEKDGETRIAFGIEVEDFELISGGSRSGSDAPAGESQTSDPDSDEEDEFPF